MLRKMLFNITILLGITACGSSNYINNSLGTPKLGMLTLHNLPTEKNDQNQSILIPLTQESLIIKNIDGKPLQGYSQKHSFFGVLKDNQARTGYIPITDGNHVPTIIPPSGSATYIGKAIMQDNTELESHLTAYFGDNAHISGSLKPVDNAKNKDPHYYITLQYTKIDGNHFNGEAVNINQEKGSYNGQFWGDNASEITGQVNFPSLVGAFGGYK